MTRLSLPYWSFARNLLFSLLAINHILEVCGLHQDQVGKFDWRKQFMGVPKYVYSHSGSGCLIVGTESGVIASLNERDGSIIWRQLLPNSCTLDHMSILKSSDDHRDYLIRTACTINSVKQSHVWNPQNGLLSSDARYQEIAEDEMAESQLADQGHVVGKSKAFNIRDELSLVVAEDGKVTLNSRSEAVWAREESLASVVAVEIVKLPQDMRDKFGMKKMIVLFTEKGKLFGLDTLTGDIIWSLYDSDLSTNNGKLTAVLRVARQADEDAAFSRVMAIHSSGVILYINPVVGDIVDKRKLPAPLIQVTQTEITTSDDIRGIIALDTQNRVHVYPPELEARVKNDIDKYYMTIVEQQPASLTGFKFAIRQNSIVPEPVWNFPISSNETIVNLGIKRVDEETHSPARVLGDRGILYKYVNPNVIAVMTQEATGDTCAPENSINIYLVDGVTGALVHSIHHPKSRGPSNLVHSENWLVYSYYSTKNRRTEVSSLEMFEGVVQTNSTAFSSLSRSHIKPKLVEHKTFIFPSGISAMVDTVTLRAMTNRHLIVALPSGALLEIPKIFLDPRRPTTMLMEHREEGLIPYMPELPIPSESMINYDQSLMAVRRITTSPAILESTSLVFAYGLDLFFTRVTPSKTFDILKDDFDHILISAVLIFLVVASYVSKLLAQRKALHAAWK